MEFASPLDYETAVRDYELALIKQREGLQIDEINVYNFRRVRRFRSKGGILSTIGEESFDSVFGLPVKNQF